MRVRWEKWKYWIDFYYNTAAAFAAAFFTTHRSKPGNEVKRTCTLQTQCVEIWNKTKHCKKNGKHELNINIWLHIGQKFRENSLTVMAELVMVYTPHLYTHTKCQLLIRFHTQVCCVAFFNILYKRCALVHNA